MTFWKDKTLTEQAVTHRVTPDLSPNPLTRINYILRIPQFTTDIIMQKYDLEYEDDE